MAQRHPNRIAISSREIVTCKRCGCPDLAWHKSARTGKFYLCQVTSQYDRLYRTTSYTKHIAAYHNCEQYKADKFAYDNPECVFCHKRFPQAEIKGHIDTCAERGITTAEALDIIRAHKAGEVRQISCGCCTNGCCCTNHMDIPGGIRPAKCGLHSGTGEPVFINV